MSRLAQYVRGLPVRIALAALVFVLAYLARFSWPASFDEVLRNTGFAQAEEPAPAPLGNCVGPQCTSQADVDAAIRVMVQPPASAPTVR